MELELFNEMGFQNNFNHRKKNPKAINFLSWKLSLHGYAMVISCSGLSFWY